MAKRVLTKEKKLKAEDYHGMCHFERTKEKKTGLLLSIKFDSRTVTIVETDNISDA